MKRLLYVAMLVALLFSGSGNAQEISNSKLRAIGQLLEVSGANAVMDVQIDLVAKELMKHVFKSVAPEISENNVDVLTLMMVEKFKDSKGDFYWRAAVVYDKYFTHDEILAMVDWYSTPLGKKTIKVMPSLMTELSEAGRLWGMEVGERVAAEIVEEYN